MLVLDRRIRAGALVGWKERLQLTKGCHLHDTGLGGAHPTASRGIQHPEWHLEHAAGGDLLQAAAGYGLPPLHQRGLHPHLVIMPGMPRIINVSQFPNMGVLLLTCIRRIERTMA
jgi:hypothetical protein